MQPAEAMNIFDCSIVVQWCCSLFRGPSVSLFNTPLEFFPHPTHKQTRKFVQRIRFLDLGTLWHTSTATQSFCLEPCAFQAQRCLLRGSIICSNHVQSCNTVEHQRHDGTSRDHSEGKPCRPFPPVDWSQKLVHPESIARLAYLASLEHFPHQACRPTQPLLRALHNPHAGMTLNT